MRILNREAVAESLSHAECIEAVEAAMRAVSRGDTIMPLRRYMDIPRHGGKFTLMPGYLGKPCTFGVKIVSKYPRSADSPYGSHVGAVMIFDSDEGIPLALLDGSELTAIRTAAASALATRILARADAATLAMLGTGTQAQHHVRALSCVRPITEVRVWGSHGRPRPAAGPPAACFRRRPRVRQRARGRGRRRSRMHHDLLGRTGA